MLFSACQTHGRKEAARSKAGAQAYDLIINGMGQRVKRKIEIMFYIHAYESQQDHPVWGVVLLALEGKERYLDQFGAHLERLLYGAMLDNFGVGFGNLHRGRSLAQRTSFQEAQLQHATVIFGQ